MLVTVKKKFGVQNFFNLILIIFTTSFILALMHIHWDITIDIDKVIKVIYRFTKNKNQKLDFVL